MCTDARPWPARIAWILAMWAGLLTACGTWPGGSPTAPIELPRHRAWVDGRQVEYVTTDISDATMAAALGVNFVPRLAQALPGPGRVSVVERVYKFADDRQISVFQSAPSPTGPGNADASYSPLWRMALVRWSPGARVRELRTEEQILAAEEAGELTVELTGIVVNCPITRSVDGVALRGAR